MNLTLSDTLARTHSSQVPHAQTYGAAYRDAAEAADLLEPDEPILCVAPSRLATALHRFILGFPGEVSYAVKANPSECILRVMAQGTITFDTASVSEIALVKSIAPRAVCHYHNPVKSAQEIRDAYREFGIRRFAVDHAGELEKIVAVIGADTTVEIAVRFRLPPHQAAVHSFGSKFGATPAEAAELLQLVSSLGYKPILTFHPGSQCLEPSAYSHHIKGAAEISRRAGIRLHALNVGGGFPVAYPRLDTPELDLFFAAIRTAVEEEFPQWRPRLEAEPGRALVAEAVSLLTRVKLVKPETGEVFLNDGIYGTLMEYSQTEQLLPRVRLIRRSFSGHRDFSIFGPTCDPLDRLPTPLSLPADIQDGDYLEFGTLGAYGSATATRFNGYGGTQTVIVEDAFSADS